MTEYLEFVRSLAPAATAVGVLVAAGSLALSARQQKRQFESFYVQRYWTLMDRLSLDVMRGDVTTSSHLSPDDEKAIRAYLRLCEDELELREGGWISRRTWRVWHSGIRAQLRNPPFALVWKSLEANVTDRDQPDFALLRRFSRTDQDPRRSWLRHLRQRLAPPAPARSGQPVAGLDRPHDSSDDTP